MNVGRVSDVCIGQSAGTPRGQVFGTLCQSTSSFSSNCLHVPVLFAILAAVAAAAAFTFPHRQPLPDISFPVLFVYHCLPGEMPAKQKPKVGKGPRPAVVVSLPTPTPSPDHSEPEEPEMESISFEPIIITG